MPSRNLLQPSTLADTSRLFPARFHAQLHPSLPISTQIFPLSHGATSHGPYGSSAVFVRYDPGMLASVPASRRQSLSTPPVDPDDSTLSLTSLASAEDGGEAEFLFFGDFESAYRAPGKEETDAAAAETANQHNRAIWEQAARSMRAGKLSSVFVSAQP